MGRWVNIIFYSWIELCYGTGLHPFTGEQITDERLKEANTKSKEAPLRLAALGADLEQGSTSNPNAASDKKGTQPSARNPFHNTLPAKPGAAPSLQQCFLQACNNTRDKLIQEVQSTVRLLDFLT
jgi:hypothetical protein